MLSTHRPQWQNTWSGKLNAANLDASPWNQPIGSADMRGVYAGVDLPGYTDSRPAATSQDSFLDYK